MKKLITFAFLMLLVQGDVALGQWVQATDPGSESVYSLIEFNGNLYAGTGNLFYSTNDGINWIRSNSSSSEGVGSIVVMGDNLFAADSGVSLSTNGGKDWKDVKSGLILSSISRVQTLAVSGENLFAGMAIYPGGHAIFLSTDSGAHWSPADNGLNTSSYPFLPGPLVEAFAVNGNNIFAGLIGGGVYLSTNNGSTWNSKFNGLQSGSNSTLVALAINGGTVFAGTQDFNGPITTSPCGIYRSIDSGASWFEVNNGLTDTIVNAIISYDGNLFASTTDGVFLSTNNGDSWQYLNGEGQPKFDAYALLVHDGYLFASSPYASTLWRFPLSNLNLSDVAQSEDTNPSITFSVFPNPASDELQILGGQAGTIHVFDIMGRECMNAPHDGSSITLDVSHLQAGTYFIRLGDQSSKIEISR